MELGEFVRYNTRDSFIEQSLSEIWTQSEYLVSDSHPNFIDEPVKASIFWQIFLIATPSFGNLSRRSIPQFLIVPTAKGNYTLVVFQTDFPKRVMALRASQFVTKEDLRIATDYWRQELEVDYRIPNSEISLENYKDAMLKTRGIINSISNDFASRILSATDMNIILCPFSERILTMGETRVSKREGVLGVSIERGSSKTSTAGIFSIDKQGRKGVTLAFHAIPELRNRGISPAVVYIDDKRAFVESTDIISDSCFAVFEDNTFPAGLLQCAGPLSGILPRMHERVSFSGLQSELTETMVSGWSPNLPFVRPYSQLIVTTKPCTNPGDSGAALFDSDGRIIGFSFDRTAINEEPEFSSWIWADSVYKAHSIIF